MAYEANRDGEEMFYLTVKDIMTELSVARSTAYQIALECIHVRVGRAIRVPRASFDNWKRVNTCAPKHRYTSEARYGGAASTRAKALRGVPPNAETIARRLLSGESLSGMDLLRPIEPRTRRSSTTPLRLVSKSAAPQGEPQGR
jgi:hypothetical protein